MLSVANQFVYTTDEPEAQQWDTLYLLLIERETKASLHRVLQQGLREGTTGPFWLRRGQVEVVFN